MVIGIGSGGITYALNVLPQVEVPIWVWIGLAILGIFIAQFLAYRDMRSSLIKQVITPNQAEKVLTQLAMLRTSGVAMRNIGLEIK